MQLNVRVPPALKQQVEEFAERNGISINAATCVILTSGLRSEKRREGRRD